MGYTGDDGVFIRFDSSAVHQAGRTGGAGAAGSETYQWFIDSVTPGASAEVTNPENSSSQRLVLTSPLNQGAISATYRVRVTDINGNVSDQTITASAFA